MPNEFGPVSTGESQPHESDQSEKEIELVRFQENEAGNYVVTSPHEEAAAAFSEQFETMRADLIEGLKSNEEGLDIARTRRFLQDMGLRADAEVLVLDDDEFEEFEARWESMFHGARDAEGVYTPGTNVVAVHRNRELEEQFGPEIIEYFIAHELAHASSDKEVYGYSLSGEGDDLSMQVTLARSGQVVVSPGPDSPDTIRGGYLEEAFADKVAQLYARDILQREHGFSVSDEVAVVSSAKGPIVLPPEYLLGEHAGKQAVASLGLDFLMGQDPTLFGSIVKARRDAQGLQEVATKITAMGRGLGQPDLYRQISMVEYDPASFVDMTRFIAELTAPATTAHWDGKYASLEEFTEIADHNHHSEPEVADDSLEDTSPEAIARRDATAQYEQEMAAQYGRVGSQQEIALNQVNSRIADLEARAEVRSLSEPELEMMRDLQASRSRLLNANEASK